MGNLWILIPVLALSIPIIAITLGFRARTEKNKIREMELQKEILELEIKQQDGKIKLLEAENKNLDKIIGS